MAEMTFAIGAPVDQARAVISQVFAAGGWTVSPTAPGGLELTRGKLGLSLLFGALAGNSFYLSQTVDFAPGPQGETLATYRTSTGKAIMGGALGVSKSNKVHLEYVERLAAALRSQGILLGMQSPS